MTEIGLWLFLQVFTQKLKEKRIVADFTIKSKFLHPINRLLKLCHKGFSLIRRLKSLHHITNQKVELVQTRFWLSNFGSFSGPCWPGHPKLTNSTRKKYSGLKVLTLTVQYISKTTLRNQASNKYYTLVRC